MSPLDGDVHIRKVVQQELDKFLVSVLPEILDKGLGRQLLPKLISCEAILGKCIVERVDS